MGYNGSPVQIVGASMAQTLAFQASAAVTGTAGTVPAVAAFAAASSPGAFDTTNFTQLAIDITVVSFVGGTSPTIVFFLDRQGADGNWYNMWPGNTSGQATGTAVTYSVDLGPNAGSWSPPNGSQHAVLTTAARLRWTTTGSPTSVTFSASVIGR